MISERVAWIDLGWSRFLRGVTVLDHTTVHVGVVGDAANRPSTDGRLTMGEVAIINEYGAPKANIPPRHFVAGVKHTNIPEREGQFVVETLIGFGNVDEALHRAGRALAQHMVDAVLRGVPPPNTISTIKKKGFDHPLIDSSGLVQAIGHELVRFGGDTVAAAGEGGEYQSFSIEGGG